MGQMYSSSFDPVPPNQHQQLNSQLNAARDIGSSNSNANSVEKSLDLNNEALIKLARSTGSQMGEAELFNQLLIHQKNGKNFNDRMNNSIDLAPFQALMNSNNPPNSVPPHSIANNTNQANYYNQHSNSHPYSGNAQNTHPKINYNQKNQNQQPKMTNLPNNAPINFPNSSIKQMNPTTQQQNIDLNSIYQLLLQQAGTGHGANQNSINFPNNQNSLSTRQSSNINKSSGSISNPNLHNSSNNKPLSKPHQQQLSQSHQQQSLPPQHKNPSQRAHPANMNSQMNRYHYQGNQSHGNVTKSQFHGYENKNYFPHANHPTQGSSVLIQQTREPAYHPQVEAISPAPEDVRIMDPNEVRLQKEREDVTKQMRFLDGEISRHESQLRNLNEREHSLNASLSEKSNSNKPVKVENLPKFVPENPIQAIISETRNQTRNQRMIFSRICGPQVSCDAYALPIYRQASDLPVIKKIQYDFRQGGFKKKLITYIKHRKMANTARLELYAKKYSQITKTYNKKTIKYLSSYSKRQKDAKYREIFEKMFPEVKKIINERERIIGEDGDKESTMKNEADQISSYDPIEEMKKMREYAVRTPMTLPPWERHKEFLWQSGRIEDPLTDHSKAQDLSTWTEEEKNTFKERYIATPKNFASIASHLDKKTVGECILYYYRTKKKESYKSLVKKNHVRRRRGPGNSNNAHNNTGSPLPKIPNEDSGSESLEKRTTTDQEPIEGRNRRGPGKKFAGAEKKPGRAGRSKETPLVTGLSSTANPPLTTTANIPGEKRKRSLNSSPDESSKSSMEHNPLSHKRGPKYGRNNNKIEEQPISQPLETPQVKPKESMLIEESTQPIPAPPPVVAPATVPLANTTPIILLEDQQENKSLSSVVKQEPNPLAEPETLQSTKNNKSKEGNSSCVQDLLNLAIERNLINNNNIKKKQEKEKVQDQGGHLMTGSERKSPSVFNKCETPNSQMQYRMSPKPPMPSYSPITQSQQQQQQQQQMSTQSTSKMHEILFKMASPQQQAHQLQNQQLKQQSQPKVGPEFGNVVGGKGMSVIPQTNIATTSSSNSAENMQVESLIHQVMTIIQQTPQQQQHQSKFILDGLMKILSGAQNIQSPQQQQQQQQTTKLATTQQQKPSLQQQQHHQQSARLPQKMSQPRHPNVYNQMLAGPVMSQQSAKINPTLLQGGMKMPSTDDGNQRTSVDSLMTSVFNSISEKINNNNNRSETPNQFQPTQIPPTTSSYMASSTTTQNLSSSSTPSSVSVGAPVANPSFISSTPRNRNNRTPDLSNPVELASFMHSQQQLASAEQQLLHHHHQQQQQHLMSSSIGNNSGGNGQISSNNFAAGANNSTSSFLFENYYASQQLNNPCAASSTNRCVSNPPITQQIIPTNIDDAKSGFQPSGGVSGQQQQQQQLGNVHRSSLDPSSLPPVRNQQNNNLRHPSISQTQQKHATAAAMFNDLVNSAIALNKNQANPQSAAILSSILASAVQNQNLNKSMNKTNTGNVPMSSQPSRGHIPQPQQQQQQTIQSLAGQQQKVNQQKHLQQQQQSQEQMLKTMQYYNEQNRLHNMLLQSTNSSANTGTVSGQSTGASVSKLMQNFPLGQENEMNPSLSAFLASMQQQQQQQIPSNFTPEMLYRLKMQQQVSPGAKISATTPTTLSQQHQHKQQSPHLATATPQNFITSQQEATSLASHSTAAPINKQPCYSPLSPSSPQSPGGERMMTGLEARKDTADTLISGETSRILKSGLLNKPISEIQNLDLRTIIERDKQEKQKNINKLVTNATTDNDKQEAEDKMSIEGNDKDDDSNFSFSDPDEDDDKDLSNDRLVIDSKICHPIKKSLDDISTSTHFAAPNLPSNLLKQNMDEALYRKRGYTDSQINLREQVNKILPPGLMEQRQRKLESDQNSIETLSVASPEKHNFGTSNKSDSTVIASEIIHMKSDVDVKGEEELSSVKEKSPIETTIEQQQQPKKSLSPSEILDSIIMKNLIADNKDEQITASGQNDVTSKISTLTTGNLPVKEDNTTTTTAISSSHNTKSNRTSPFDSLNERINKVIQDKITIPNSSSSSNNNNEVPPQTPSPQSQTEPSLVQSTSDQYDGEQSHEPKNSSPSTLPEQKRQKPMMTLVNPSAVGNLTAGTSAICSPDNDKNTKKSESPYSNPDYMSPLNLKIDLLHAESKESEDPSEKVGQHQPPKAKP